MPPPGKRLADKLLIKWGQTVRVLNAPKGESREHIDGATSVDEDPDVEFLYALTEADVKKFVPEMTARRLWIAYPKAGQLRTDLNRDILWKLVEPLGLEGVRLVSVDDTWSAMMFKKAKS